MTRLRDLKNLGPKSKEMLIGAGIRTPQELQSLGSVEAYMRVERSGAKPSLNLLYALEGAIHDRRWQEVSRAERARLLIELDAAGEHRTSNSRPKTRGARRSAKTCA
ncbi:MAG: TfoX/Sxy family protein [Gammaproteobacteria bacterium]